MGKHTNTLLHADVASSFAVATLNRKQLSSQLEKNMREGYFQSRSRCNEDLDQLRKFGSKLVFEFLSWQDLVKFKSSYAQLPSSICQVTRSAALPGEETFEKHRPTRTGAKGIFWQAWS